MIHRLRSNRFPSIIQSHDVRPGATADAQITPAQNAYGSYATVLGTPLANPAYAIEITVREVAVSGAPTDSLTTIGIDPAGGTAFVDTIQHLLTSYAGQFSNDAGMGVRYKFPLYIPAGATIGAKGSINNATVGEQRVQVKCFCRPQFPELLRVGKFVRTFGADTANSKGTALTFGTTGEGAWTQLGTVADPNLWAWCVTAAPVNITTMLSGLAYVDLAIGDGSNKSEIIVGHEVQTMITEDVNQICLAEEAEAGNADNIYARGQYSSSTTAWSAIAYAVGG